MLIEKLVWFEEPPSVVSERLKQAWQSAGFELRQVEPDENILLSSGYPYHRVRADVQTFCLAYESGTLVQMIYSPALTPAFSRPINLQPAVQERFFSEIGSAMEEIFKSVGKPKPVTRMDIPELEEDLQDPFNIRISAKRASSRRRILLGLIVAAIGTLMSFLQFKDILSIGSYGLWLTTAIIGLAVFCVGLFNFIWGR